MTNDELKNLSYISKAIGQYSSYVQGGGGNTSVKMGSNKMAIKASGYLLSDVTETSGFSVVDYNAIRSYLEKPDDDEEEFVRAIKSFVMETDNRPSIETGFHVLLGDYVIHTHSVYANILNCSQEGMGIAEKIFPDSLWIEYATPGRDLTLKIKDAIAKHNGEPEIIFLQNHGVIISGKNFNNVLNLHESLNNKIKEFLNIDKDSFDSWNVIKDFSYVKDHILFPDQVVYTYTGGDSLKSPAAEQTLLAYSFILATIEQKHLTPNFIDKRNIDILLNMESEKYRIKVMKESGSN